MPDPFAHVRGDEVRAQTVVSVSRACLACGGSMEGRRRQALYCSDRCRAAASRGRMKCPHCGKSIVGGAL